LDKHASDVIDRLTKRLQNPPAAKANDDTLVVVTLEAFYNLTKNPDISSMMKKTSIIISFQ